MQKIIGPYEVLEQLGSGGMGVVYRARDARLQRDVAIKVLPDGFLGPGTPGQATHERFLREARSASSLNHPNICTIYDVGEQDGKPYLVMEPSCKAALLKKRSCGAHRCPCRKRWNSPSRSPAASKRPMKPESSTATSSRPTSSSSESSRAPSRPRSSISGCQRTRPERRNATFRFDRNRRYRGRQLPHHPRINCRHRRLHVPGTGPASLSMRAAISSLWDR